MVGAAVTRHLLASFDGCIKAKDVFSTPQLRIEPNRRIISRIGLNADHVGTAFSGDPLQLLDQSVVPDK